MRSPQILAQSSQRLSASVKAVHPEIGRRGIAAFRNILVHDYLGINTARVWEVVEQDLPTLERTVGALPLELGDSP